MADVRTLFCPNCGAPIHHGDLDCEYCSAALYAGRATEVTVPALAKAQHVIPEMQARIKQNPYDGDAYYQLGLACFTLKLYRQAEDAFEQGKRFSPGDPLVHYFMGLTLLRRGEPEILSLQEYLIRAMKKEFDAARSLDPNLAEAGIYGTLAGALLARSGEDYAGAIAPLNAVVQALPNLAVAWKVLAACYFQVSAYENAAQAARRGLQLEPDDAELAYLVGAAHACQQEMDEAEAWARRYAALRGTPTKWQTVLREFRGQIE